ncbi:EamA family transporter [Vineibacter terrae]|uniref:EamA family transporter n=1 Tax=Vineibacter terrae TaxID=2586908 RepID=A0A5C8PJN9_9HYPH|nr:EamA family transporter [Vineibacter terrae]TXL73569.1 EamA family transporter [Vineibacter terrae]
MRPSDVALALVVMAIWGLNFVAVRVGVQEIPPILFVTLRFACAFLLMVPFVPWPKGRLRDLLVLSFMLGSLHFTTMFTGARYLEAGTMAVVSQLQAVFSALLARLWFGERLGAVGWAGMAIAFGGVLLIAGEPAVGDHLWALVLPVLGCAFFALYHAHVKRIGTLSANVLNCWVSLLIVPQTLVLSLVLESGQMAALRAVTWSGVAALLYQVVPMVIVSYWAWYRLLYRYPLTRVAPFQMLVPLFGVLAGALMLGEPLTLQKIAGGAVTIVGVALVVLRPARDRAPGQPSRA